MDRFASQDAKTTGNEKRLPVRFVFHDDQTSPQVAVKLTHSVLASRPILRSAISAMCSVMAPLVKNGPVMYCLSPAIHPAPGGYVFTAAASTYDLFEAMACYFRPKSGSISSISPISPA